MSFFLPARAFMAHANCRRRGEVSSFEARVGDQAVAHRAFHGQDTDPAGRQTGLDDSTRPARSR